LAMPVSCGSDMLDEEKISESIGNINLDLEHTINSSSLHSQMIMSSSL